MIAEFEKGTLEGETKAPPSKSVAHRALICAALSSGESAVKGIDMSEDILATLECLKSFGTEINVKESDVYIKGFDAFNINECTVNARESGSTLRFLIPVAMLSENKVVFKGYGRLMNRPLGIYEQLAQDNNLLFEKKEDMVLVQGRIKNGEYVLNGDISSQFITGLLFALPLLEGDSVIKIIPPFESKSYVDLTLSVLEKYGIEICYDGEYTYKIKGNQKYQSCNYLVEGDYSNGAFLDVFNYLEGNVKLNGLEENSVQGDKVYKEYFEKLELKNPELDISDCPDLGPVLIALATLKNGAVLTGTKRLAVKESDRGKVMAEELKKLGADIICCDNKIIINKKELINDNIILNGHNDHRIVMALSTVLTVTGGRISGIEAVKKSFPGYFEVLKELKAKVTLYDS